jgi:1-acyl-sn-glycerol-3-phosphate acyltransferase
MKKKAVFKGGFLYWGLYAYSRLMHRLYYRRITVIGRQRIPKDAALLLAPNHQNALMDALAAAFALNRPVGFLARADIFKKPVIAALLNFMRILPVYRIRDGFGSLDNNKDTFGKTVAAIESGISICILPEGNHDGHKRLRPLKKGIFRVAFQAEDTSKKYLNLHVIPVGIDYSDYFHAGSDLLVVFGKPICIQDFVKAYHQSEQHTITMLTAQLAGHMREVMIDIPEEDYELIRRVSEIYEPILWKKEGEKRNAYQKFLIKQRIIATAVRVFASHPHIADHIEDSFYDYDQVLTPLRIPDFLMERKEPHFVQLLAETLLYLALAPLYLYGLILNFIPFRIPVRIANRVKDPNFKSSVQFGIALLLFPIYYLLLTGLCALFTRGALIPMAFAFSLPVSGLFSFYYYSWFRLLIQKIRLRWLKMFRKQNYRSVMILRENLLTKIKSALNQ